MILLWPDFSIWFSHTEIWKIYLFVTLLLITGYTTYILLSPEKQNIFSAEIIWPILYIEGCLLFFTNLDLLIFIAWFITLFVYSAMSCKRKELQLFPSLIPLVVFAGQLVFFEMCWIIFRRTAEVLFTRLWKNLVIPKLVNAQGCRPTVTVFFKTCPQFEIQQIFANYSNPPRQCRYRTGYANSKKLRGPREFDSWADFEKALNVWSKEYNEDYPHSSLAYVTPYEYERWLRRPAA